MFETLVSFEPTFTLNGIPISPSGCQAPLLRKTSGEGKSVVAVTHLALLGVKRQEPAFWAYTEDERELLATLFFARISKGKCKIMVDGCWHTIAHNLTLAEQRERGTS